MKFNDVAIGIAEASIALGAIRGYVLNTVNNTSVLASANQNAFASEFNTTPPAQSPLVNISQNPYRPAEWDNPSLVYAKTSLWPASSSSPNGTVQTSAGYFFDAIIRADHTTTCRITDHPIQNGASISDHAFQLPDHLTLEIGMSDAMDRLVAGQFSDYASKSVSAYQTLKQWQISRVVLSIQTRLNNYQNMLIESIHTSDDYKTRDGLRCTVNFKQIIMATVATSVVSARPQASGSPVATTKQTQQPSATVLGAAESAINGPSTGNGASGSW